MRLKIFLVAFSFLNAGFAAETSPNSNEDSLLAKDGVMLNLIRWEVFRLGKLGNPAVRIPKELSLHQILNSKLAEETKKKDLEDFTLEQVLEGIPEVESKEELSEILALLRAANVTQRYQTESDKQVMRDLVQGEISILNQLTPNAELSLPKELVNKLANAKAQKEGTPEEEIKNLTEFGKALPNAEALSEKEWRTLLGSVRKQGIEGLGDKSTLSFKLDSWQDAEFNRASELGEKNRSPDLNSVTPGGRLSEKAPRDVASINRERKNLFDHSGDGNSGGLPPAASPPRQRLLPSTPGSGRQSFGGNGGGSGGGRQNGGGSPQKFHPLSEAESIPLKRGMSEGGFSLPIMSRFVGYDSGSAACQLTATGKKELGQGVCEYEAATADHCIDGRIERRVNGRAVTVVQSRPLASMYIHGIGNIEFGEGSSNRISRHPTEDIGLVHFQAQCKSQKEVPIVPFAESPPQDGEGILVDARDLIAGRARGDRANSMVMDVRGNEIGIEPGDSGGGVVVVRDGKRLLAGVISTKFTSSNPAFAAQLRGLGRFTTIQSLALGNRPDAGTIASASRPEFSAAQASAFTH